MHIADTKHIHIAGAGLVGSLLSILFAQKGYKVCVYEKRSDPRTNTLNEGRSINLALSHRGIRSLALAGLDQKVLSQAIAMKGRMVHDTDGSNFFIPYGQEGQHIYSVSRNDLNKILLEEAESKHGVEYYFNQKIEALNLKDQEISTSNEDKNRENFDVLIGADGAFSQVRQTMEQSGILKSNKNVLEHGYKELPMPPDKNGNFAMEPNALHIWPREQFMLIALPNTDKSFTCTLFLAEKGEISFDKLKDKTAVHNFFEEYFPNVLPLIPDIEDKFLAYPVSTLTEIKVSPWNHDNVLLIGDAAHAIVPFYGQGMNAGFEDCRLLTETMEENIYESWDELFAAFQRLRKPDADGIADLAMHNFIEMRDLVNDKDFLLRKKTERILHELFPDKFLPLYTMVTFTDIPYNTVLHKSKEQDKIIDLVIKKHPNPEDLKEDGAMKEEIKKLLNNLHR